MQISSSQTRVEDRASFIPVSPVDSESRVNYSERCLRKRTYSKWNMGHSAMAVNIIILFAFVFFSSSIECFYYPHPAVESSKCTSRQCYRAAARLMQTMDRRVDPCVNFYDFVCGNYEEEHPIPDIAIYWDNYFEKNQDILKKVRDFLEENLTDDEPSAVSKAKVLYKSCMDTGNFEDLQLEPMYQILQKIGLPVQPMFQSFKGKEPTKDNDNWISILVRAKKVMNMDLLIGFYMGPADRNNSVYRIVITKPDENDLPLSSFLHFRSIEKGKSFARSTSNDNDDDDDEDPFEMYILRTMARVDSEYSTSSGSEFRDILMAARETKDVVLELNEIEDDADLNDDEEVELSIQELQELTEVDGIPQINWSQYFILMFDGIKNLTDGIQDFKVVVEHKEYYRELAKILAGTPRKTIELVLWWKMVTLMIPYTTEEMISSRQEYLQKASEVKAPQSRTMFCANAVKQAMPIVVSYILAENDFFTNEKKVMVEDIIRNVESAFSSMILSSKWMDKKSKEASFEKVRAVKYFIAFPDWILNRTTFEEHYSQVLVTGSNFLLDMAAILEGKTKKQLEKLGKKYEPDEFPSDPLDINAFYYANMNSLELPAGILQYPFLDLGLQSLNYGSIGALIGHELNHGFEQFGRKFDKTGNMRQWWSNSTVAEFERRTQCFIQQFNEYKLEGINVNGNRTLAENLADFSGLHAAFLAYQTLQNKTGIEGGLPGLEEFTPEQLFFLSYGNFWCQAWTPKYIELMANDEHAPNYFRILGSLHNSEAFSRVWKCPNGSPMNPTREKCLIW